MKIHSNTATGASADPYAKTSTRKLEKMAGSGEILALAELLDRADDGKKIYMRKGTSGQLKVTGRGLTAGYSHLRADQAVKTAANTFARSLGELCDRYSGYDPTSYVGMYVAVLRNILKGRKEGHAIENSRELRNAIHALGENEPLEAGPAEMIRAKDAKAGKAEKELNLAVSKKTEKAVMGKIAEHEVANRVLGIGRLTPDSQGTVDLYARALESLEKRNRGSAAG